MTSDQKDWVQNFCSEQKLFAVATVVDSFSSSLLTHLNSIMAGITVKDVNAHGKNGQLISIALNLTGS